MLGQGGAAISAVDDEVSWGGHWVRHGADSSSELGRLWDEVRAGRPVPTLSWSPSGGPYARCPTAELTSWQRFLTTSDGGAA